MPLLVVNTEMWRSIGTFKLFFPPPPSTPAPAEGGTFFQRGIGCSYPLRWQNFSLSDFFSNVLNKNWLKRFRHKKWRFRIFRGVCIKIKHPISEASFRPHWLPWSRPLFLLNSNLIYGGVFILTGLEVLTHWISSVCLIIQGVLWKVFHLTGIMSHLDYQTSMVMAVSTSKECII